MAGNTSKIVLIVEDDKNLREIIGFTLRARGWTILMTGNGDEALELATSKLPDLILLDVMIPGRTGFELCSILKGDPRTSHIRIVFLSGITRDSGKSDEHWRQLSNADAFISKPFQATHLVRCIETLLEKSGEKVKAE